ncbi:MAG: hypothetical protein VX642_04740 [Bdellovibrionota bacterium]|nr:hypothetical protein [Bdellovibrionota bacterium]
MDTLIQNTVQENSARKHYANHQKNRTERRAIFSKSFIQALLELTSSATALLYANNQNEILSGIIGFITLAIVVRNIPKILNGIKLLRALPKNNVDAIIRANRTAEEERKRINKHIQKINRLIRENITKSCQASARRITRN